MTGRGSPFEDVERMFERMSEQFEGVGETEELSSGHVSVDIAEDDEAVTVTADLPGFAKEDIEISIRDGRLSIRAERDEESEGVSSDEDTTYHRRERTHREVSRTLRIPADVEEEDASASYQNGVLTVTLPKSEIIEEGHSIDVE